MTSTLSCQTLVFYQSTLLNKANVLRKPTCTHCLKTLRDSFHTFLTQFRYFDAIRKPNSDLYFSVLLLFQRAGSTSLMNVNLKNSVQVSRYNSAKQILKLRNFPAHGASHSYSGIL